MGGEKRPVSDISEEKNRLKKKRSQPKRAIPPRNSKGEGGRSKESPGKEGEGFVNGEGDGPSGAETEKNY